MAMTGKRGNRLDPMEREIELALEPGSYISDAASFSFVTRLDQVSDAIAKLIPSEPERAVTLYETFMACCYEKAEELDDSSGSFGQFAGNLFCGWIRARQAARADPDHTAIRVLSFMDHDPYGFAHRLERGAAKTFDSAGLAAFESRIRARFEAAASEKPRENGSPRGDPDLTRRRWGEVLRTLYLAQQNVAAYVAISEQIGFSAQDCHAIATMLVARRQHEDALAWVERGLTIEKRTSFRDFAGGDLTRLRRILLSRLGRGNEALESAWTDFRKHPSRFAYEDLMMFVPKTERSAWHGKAMDALAGADLYSAIELLLGAKEMDRLAELLRRSQDGALQRVSHRLTEPAAKKLEKLHPDLAARLWRAQAMRIVDAGKSKYYDAALSNLERAMVCFKKAGLTAAWEATVNEVRERHSRKSGFMPGFERLVTGRGPNEAPSFLKRAKARWGGREPEVT